MVHMHLLPFGVMWKVFLFTLLPLILVNYHINFLIMTIMTVIAIGMIIRYAPAATKRSLFLCDLLSGNEIMRLLLV